METCLELRTFRISSMELLGQFSVTQKIFSGQRRIFESEVVLNGANVRLQIDQADKVLLKRNLSRNGKGQQFFTHEVRRLSDPYVPFLTGTLKNSATETPTTITYNTPYARRQYYEHRGNGLRGAQWDKRMWADRGKEIVQSVAAYCGGKSK